MPRTDLKDPPHEVDTSSESSTMATKSRPSSARPSASKRSSIDRSSRGNDLVYECKAAYLVVFDSIDEQIETRKHLVEGMFYSFVGRDCYPSMVVSGNTMLVKISV